MSENRLEKQGSPTGLKRLLFRLPIALYRARLGFLFGKRLLMLEHFGRRSGERRRTVLEVVVNKPDAVYVASAWGAKAQWLANLKANPVARFFLGSKVYSTTAEMVSVETAHELMAEYASQHVVALAKISAFMLDDPPDTPEGQAAAVAEAIPMVKLPKNG